MGVAQDRISVIAFGEQNPVEPNAKPDGTPNERGREANRRVDVTVALLSPVEADGDQPEEADKATTAPVAAQPED